jgi:hypothetical protein
VETAQAQQFGTRSLRTRRSALPIPITPSLRCAATAAELETLVKAHKLVEADYRELKESVGAVARFREASKAECA